MKSKKINPIKAAILNWLGVPLQLTDSDFWDSWNNGTSSAGQVVNEKSVLSLSAAWACTRLISETIATLPLQIYETTSKGRSVAKDHPLYYMLHTKPNSKSTAVTYWESSSAAILLRGNSFSRKKYINGRVVGIEFMPFNRLKVEQRTDYTYQLSYQEDNKSWTVLKDSEIFHVPGFSLDGKYGISAISYGAGVFGSALASSTAANGVFEKGLLPTVAFTMQEVLKQEQREEFRDNFAAIAGAINSGKPALLEGGMTATPIGINPADAQLLESRQYSVEEVCRWFRVDPSMVGHGNKDSNWGTGLEQKLIAFITFTLRPWLTRIEQAINTNLIGAGGNSRYYAEFNIAGLLRADSAARAAFYSVMVNNGIFTRDEVRVLENMPVRGGNADVLMAQTAMAPIDSLGANTTGDTARAALSAWLNQQEDESRGES